MQHFNIAHVTGIRNSKPTTTPDIFTSVVRNPGVTVESKPGGVSGGGREATKKVKLLVYSYSCVAALYGCAGMVILSIQNTHFVGSYTLKTIP